MLRPLSPFKKVGVFLVNYLLDTLEYIFTKVAEWESNVSLLPVLGMPKNPSRLNFDRTEFYWASFLSAHPELDESIRRFRGVSFSGETVANGFYKAILNIPLLNDVPKIERTFWFKEGSEFVKEYGYQGYYVKPFYGMIMLPDWVASKINLLIAYNEAVTVDDLEIIRRTLILLLVYYQMLNSIKVTIEVSFISFNPYMNFVSTLVWAMYDWIDHYFGFFFPVFIGIPWSLPVCFGMVNLIRNKLLRLFITAPYLPSEAIVKVVNTKNGLQDVLYFEGLPQQWLIHGIPNADRLDWYFNRPHVLEYMYQNFGEKMFKLVPDYIPDHFL